MTCIIIEFREKGDNKVNPPIKNEDRRKKTDKRTKKTTGEESKFKEIMNLLQKKKQEQAEK